MPIYTYRCESCGVQFEQNQKFADAPLTRCPECGKKSLRKVYTPVGIVFKGSGFYATDHRSPSGSRSAAAAHAEEKAAAEGKTGDSGSNGTSPSDKGASTPGTPASDKSASNKPASSASSDSK